MVGMGGPGGAMMAIDHPSKATMHNNMVQMVGGPPGGRGSSPAGPFSGPMGIQGPNGPMGGPGMGGPMSGLGGPGMGGPMGGPMGMGPGMGGQMGGPQMGGAMGNPGMGGPMMSGMSGPMNAVGGHGMGGPMGGPGMGGSMGGPGMGGPMAGPGMTGSTMGQRGIGRAGPGGGPGGASGPFNGANVQVKSKVIQHFSALHLLFAVSLIVSLKLHSNQQTAPSLVDLRYDVIEWYLRGRPISSYVR